MPKKANKNEKKQKRRLIKMKKLINLINNFMIGGELKMDKDGPKMPEQSKKQTSEKGKKIERFFGFLEKVDKKTDKYLGETMPENVRKGLEKIKGHHKDGL